MPMVVERKWVCDVAGCGFEKEADSEIIGVAYHFLKWLDLPHGWTYMNLSSLSNISRQSSIVGHFGLVCPNHKIEIDRVVEGEPQPDPETVKQAMEDVKAGKSRTAKEILDEIRDRD